MILSRPRRPLRLLTSLLVGAMALSVTPVLGAGVAGAADPLPPAANPIAEGAVCEGASVTNPFSDLGAESATTRQVILCLVASGLTAGTSGSTFTPGGAVTRRQMALFVKRLADMFDSLELESLNALPAYDGVPEYSDVVAEGPAFREAIGQLSQAGIVGGFSDGSFRPGALVSRRQMAAFVNRLEEHVRGVPYSTEADHFDDDDGDSGEADLNALASVGIFQGDPSGNVFPGAAISRRQMANVVMRDAQVYFADEAIRSPITAPVDFIAVEPSAVLTDIPFPGADSNTSLDDHEYEATGLSAGQPYRITLFDHLNLDVDATGGIVLVEDGTTGFADSGSVTARIVRVNGSALSGGQIAQSIGGVVPESGVITFTVDGDDPEQVVPVIHVDEGGDDSQLDIDAGGHPLESFGIGGRIRYLGEEAEAGDATVTVADITLEHDAFTSNDEESYLFGVGDFYRYKGDTITHAEFVDMFSVGDVVSVDYDPDAGQESTFDITTDDVDAPARPTVAVTNADGGATDNDVRVTYARPGTNPAGATYALQRAVVAPGPDAACGTADDLAPGAFVTVPGTSEAAGQGVRTFVVSDANVPDGCYAYRVLATSSTSDVTSASAASSPASAVPDAGDVVRPISTYATQSTSAGAPNLLDAGDVIQIVFSERLGPIAEGAALHIAEPDGFGTTGSITEGVQGTFEVNTAKVLVGEVERAVGTVLTITLTSAPQENTSFSPGLAPPVNITAGPGITDQAGNTWNVAASTDITIEG